MKKNLFAITVIFFVASIFISYAFVALTLQRTYSIPDNEANYSNSTRGGEALTGEHPIPVMLNPHSGTTNVSLDTLIYLYETRPVSNNLTISPDVEIIEVTQEHVGQYSRITTYYPSENLRPHTTYNVSGTIMNLSAWWTFTTGSSVTPQQDYEILLSPYAGWIALLVSIVATAIFIFIIKHSQLKNNN